MSDNKTIDWPADHEEENVGLRAENQDLKTDIQYVREENELLKERNAVLLQALKDLEYAYSRRHSIKSDASRHCARILLQKYAAL